MALTYYSPWDAILQQDLVFDAARLFDDIIPPPQELDFGAFPTDSYFNVDSFFQPENDIPLPPQYDDSCIELDSFDSMKRQKLIVDDVAIPPANENSGLSPQSIAARQRRRKISDKTRELGKLVPGGTRMNTAEMFGAAYKYIQYLQAQVGILEFMATSTDHHGAESFKSEQLLHGLLQSTSIQEKLYSTEKCMLPRAFVRELANDQEVILEGLNH